MSGPGQLQVRYGTLCDLLMDINRAEPTTTDRDKGERAALTRAVAMILVQGYADPRYNAACNRIRELCDGTRPHGDVAIQLMREYPHPAPNADVDRIGDHGIEDRCDRCTDAGCLNVAAPLKLTVEVTVRRTAGPAATTGEILWQLQDHVTAVGEFGVGVSAYGVEYVGSAIASRNGEAPD